ncbi:hypothetical protein P6166_13030 [Stenotrophomonas sp. HITSZ_GD]|uniref:hypothetical protein n=1 Tax=Stenotrophomonas sp. HITSZ_GD TaxID=3037248 RepID=UPI00240D6BFD|nr:hypothetical protein [Stenotrophomonas sp. HITSZ_GD]MDG2526278.1 hypothetical protein [Stenotrophomonas sp. HITSZ_GD]
MPAFYRLLQGIGFALGLCLAAWAIGLLFVVGLGEVAPNVRGGFFTTAGVLLLLATPLLAWPYWPRVARWAAGIALCGLAGLVSFYAFRSSVAGPLIKASAVALCVLAVVRVVLAWRRSEPTSAPQE